MIIVAVANPAILRVAALSCPGEALRVSGHGGRVLLWHQMQEGAA
ncbi:hypothetical protein [Jannaschia faecimaris]|nr:hypothetical protein [Jannaschia faecimaris]